MAKQINKTGETLARAVIGIDNACRVDVVGGDSEPRLVGESWHYETRGGRRIRHPGAYSRCGWSNMRYVASDRRVEVGSQWLARASAELDPASGRYDLFVDREFSRAL